MLARRVTSILVKGVASNGKLVTVQWDNGEESSFHASWLRDNCKCSECVTASGQKIPQSIVPSQLRIEKACIDGGSVDIKWQGGIHNKSSFEADWLRKFAYSDSHLDREEERLAALEHRFRLPEIDYEQLTSSEEGTWKWLECLNESGLCLIKNVPPIENMVKKIANLAAPCSHSIYGETFHVKVDPKPINIAYSDSALAPHMDLAYFESPPGVQMLHCLEFESGVEGGESTFIDGHAVAEELKKINYEAFKVLKTVPATFQKDHLDRNFPLKMFYQRPHISVNYRDQVTAVFWSPPFEGPLRVRGDKVDLYYNAYADFSTLLKEKEMWNKHGTEFRMEKGDLITFNNRRMPHGRNAFTSQCGLRHLQGCYMDIDMVLNKYRLLSSQYRKTEAPLGATGEFRLGNSSHR